MATKGYYQKRYEKIHGSSSDLDKQNKKVNNLKARLEQGGVDVEKELDDRNWLEKLLNLRQDQGLIKDVFEVLNRPQQAIFSGWRNAQEGGSFGEGAKKGITGNDDTQFKDILMNTGDFDDTKDKIDLVDVLGVAGDLFLDPLDLALIPVTGGGSVAAKAVSKTDDVADAAKVVSKGAKALDTASDASKTIKFKSVNDLLGQAAGKAIKKGAKITDNSIEKLLAKLDETKGVKTFDNLGNVLSENAKIVYGNKGANRATDLLPIVKNDGDFLTNVKIGKGRLETYKGIKNNASDLFKKSKASVKAILTRRAAKNTENEVKLKINNIIKTNENLIDDYAKKSGKNADKVGEDISLFVESMMDRSIEKDDLLDLVREGKVYSNQNIMSALDDMKNQIPDNIKKSLDLNITTDDKGIIKLGSGWDKDILKGNGFSSFKDLDEANSIISDYGNWYTKSDLKQIEKLKKDNDFRGLINNLFGEIKDGDKLIIDPLSDSIKILPYPQSQRKWEEQYENMVNFYKKQGLSEDEILENIKRKNIFGTGDTEGGGYVQTSNSFKINKKLREDLPLGGDTKTVEDLDKYIGGYKTKEDLGLMRKTSNETINKIFGLPENYNISQTADALKSKIGEPIVFNKGFTSTAIGEGPFYVGENATLKIKAPNGSNMFIVNSQEREAILKRGQQMILRHIDTKNGEILLDFDLYDGKGKYLASIANNKTINNANKLLDEAFGTNFSRFNADNSAYLPHTLANKEMVESAKNINETILKGNTSLLSQRKRLGSMREINNLYKQSFKGPDVPKESLEYFKKYPKLFEENFNKAFANKYYDMTGLAKQNKIVNDLLIEQTFNTNYTRENIVDMQRRIKELTLSGNKKELEKLSKEYNTLIKDSSIKYLTEFDSSIPKGSTKLNSEQCNEIVNKLKKIRQSVGSDDAGYNKLISIFSNNDGGIAINNDVLNLLQVTINQRQQSELLNAYDKMLNLFKSSKTLSFTNSLNNIVGNSTNLYLSGIGPMEQARLMPKALNVLNNGQNAYLKSLSGEVLTKKETELADIWKKFIDTGFGNEEIALDLQDLPDFMKDLIRNGKTNKKINAKDVVTFVPKLNMRANVYTDNLDRIIVLLKSMEDKSYLSRLGINGANEIDNYRKAISKVMFDPSMMTDAEKTVMKRIIPFYTYAKNNLVFQIDNIGRNGSRYNRLLKGIRSLQRSATDDNEENLADYVKDNLYIPIPVLDKDGNYSLLKTQLPFSDLIELTDDPLSYLVNKSGPLIKSPIELALNKNTFNGLDIEKFPGEKSNDLPFLTKKQEKIIGDLTGLDVPAKTISKLVSGDPLSTVLMRGNVDKDKINRSYEEIDELNEIMKQYKQKGYEFSTINELKKANKNNTISGIQTIFDKYGIE